MVASLLVCNPKSKIFLNRLFIGLVATIIFTLNTSASTVSDVTEKEMATMVAISLLLGLGDPRVKLDCPILWDPPAKDRTECYLPIQLPYILFSAQAETNEFIFPYFAGGESGPVTTCGIYKQFNHDQITFHAGFPTSILNPNDHTNFSYADLGDGTVFWGLYVKESGEEWSGSGIPTMKQLLGKRNELGFQIVARWEGIGTENFTSQKKAFQIEVRCEFIYFDPS